MDEAEHDERQQQREDVPAEQQGRARLNQKLPEAAFQDEEDHPVEGQHDSEEADGHPVGNFVAVVQEIVRGEGQERGRQADPPIGREPGQRVIRQDAHTSKQQQHQYSAGVDLGRQVLAEGQGGQLDERVPAQRIAAV